MAQHLDEEAVRFIMENTWSEATGLGARLAREAAGVMPPEVDGRTALSAFADTIDNLNRKRDRTGGAA